MSGRRRRPAPPSFSCTATHNALDPTADSRLEIAVSRVEALPGGRVVFSCGSALKVWSSTGCVKQLDATGGRVIYCFAILPNGNVVVSSASGSGRRPDEDDDVDPPVLEVWDLAAGCVQKTLNGHSARVNCLAALPGGGLVSCSAGPPIGDLTLRCWDLEDGSCRTLVGPSGYISALVALSEDRFISGGGWGAWHIRLWDVTAGGCIDVLNASAHMNAVRSIAVLNGCVYSGAADKKLKCWDLSDGGRYVNGRIAHDHGCMSVAVLPEGHIVSAGKDGTIKIWDARLKKCFQTLTGHTRGVTDVAILNGSIVSVSYDGTLKIWQNTQRLAERTTAKALARQRLNGDVAKTICMYL